MKVLFDHNPPHKLRTGLAKHEIVTAAFMGWAELKNGELLRVAEGAGFDVFLTGDRSLVHEQSPAIRRLAIIALSTNNWPIVKNHVSRIQDAIDSAVSGSFQEVDCGIFNRKR